MYIACPEYAERSTDLVVQLTGSPIPVELYIAVEVKKSWGVLPVVETYTSTPSRYEGSPERASNSKAFELLLLPNVIAGVTIQSFAVPGDVKAEGLAAKLSPLK